MIKKIGLLMLVTAVLCVSMLIPASAAIVTPSEIYLINTTDGTSSFDETLTSSAYTVENDATEGGTETDPVWKFSNIDAGDNTTKIEVVNAYANNNLRFYKGRTYTVSYKVKASVSNTVAPLYMIDMTPYDGGGYLGIGETSANVAVTGTATDGSSFTSTNIRGSADYWGGFLANKTGKVSTTDYTEVTYSFTPTSIITNKGSGSETDFVFLKTGRILVEVPAGTEDAVLWIKDFTIKETMNYSVTADITGEGTVTLDGTVLSDGDVVYNDKNEAVELSVVPADGYVIDSVSFGGEAVAVNDNTSLTTTVTPVFDGSELSVTFKAPTVVGGGETYLVENGTAENNSYLKNKNANVSFEQEGDIWKLVTSTALSGANILELNGAFEDKNLKLKTGHTYTVRYSVKSDGSVQFGLYWRNLDGSPTLGNTTASIAYTGTDTEGDPVSGSMATCDYWGGKDKALNYIMSSGKRAYDDYEVMEYTFTVNSMTTGGVEDSDGEAFIREWNFQGDISENTTVYIKDFYVIETAPGYDVTVAVEGNGTVSVDGTAVTTGDVIKAGSDAVTVSVAPASGYEVKSVSLGDTPYTVNATGGTITFENISAATTLSVVFEKVSAPAITGASNAVKSSITYIPSAGGSATYSDGPVVYIYYTLNNFEYASGAYSGVTVNGLELKHNMAASAGTSYAIAVLGDEIVSGASLTFTPFVVDNGSTVTGVAQTPDIQ